MERRKIEVKLNEYNYTCGDGCCTHYGIVTTVDGVELPCHNTDIQTNIMQLDTL